MPTTRHHSTYRGKLIRIVFWSGRVVDCRYREGRGHLLITDAGRFRFKDVKQFLFRLASDTAGNGGTQMDPVKPKCTLSGTDGNVFALAGKVTRALKQAGQIDKAKDFNARLVQCGSYDAALQLMMEYVDVQ